MRIGKDNENFLPYMESFWPKSVKSGKDNENPAKIMVAKIMRIDCNIFNNYRRQDDKKYWL